LKTLNRTSHDSIHIPSFRNGIRLKRFVAAFIALACAMMCTACDTRPNADSSQETPAKLKASEAVMIDSPNKAIVDDANAAGKWVHARKTRPIWAKLLESAQTVKTLEGEEQVEAGHYLCRGEAGDIWPQTEKDLTRRYKATDELDADGWQKYQPNPDAEGVMATQIDHPFSVEASWGKLTGKAGDYLLKNFHDRDTAYPEDVWIVDQKLFQQTYEKEAVETKTGANSQK